MPPLLMPIQHRSVVRHGDHTLAFQRRFTTMLDFPVSHSRKSRGRTERNYYYCPPSQQDPVLQIIKRTIRDLAKIDIAVAGADLRVAHRTSSPPIWPPSAEGNEVKFYTFKEFYEDVPLTVPVIIHAQTNSRKLTDDMIYIRIRGVNVPLVQFLQNLPAREWLLQGRQGTKSQQKWWRENGAPFRLMDLPPELRLIIYKHALGPIYPRTQYYAADSLSDPDHRSHARLTFGNGYNTRLDPCPVEWDSKLRRRQHACWFVPENRPDISPPNLQLLLANRQTHAEALAAGWNGTLMHFVFLQTFIDVSCARLAPGPAVMFNSLSRIQLNFQHEEYFILMGVNVRNSFDINPALSKVHHLENISTLKHLQLRFRSPNDGYSGSPWNFGDFRFTGCQRIMVDWIITMLFPTIRKIPKVTFTGFIKTATKQKWDHRLQKVKMDGFSETDHEEELCAIFRHKSEPPPCLCPKSCRVTYASRDDTKIAIGGRNRSYLRHWFNTCEDFDFDDTWKPDPLAEGHRYPKVQPCADSQGLDDSCL
ncbi:hypothetical protein P154DRAFT_572866 [Amniculicola lignicola CBS 123094]|uniref:Uncharacterized protein n=1 Tax=Amniculicola lignicola CBS 123094 TaxID=1392246 RepID=A0A6A5WRI0_9PLEO|nr:hypothetical protein P154DRAFT_572866 [Amniculicola lignicola CBS 123094]